MTTLEALAATLREIRSRLSWAEGEAAADIEGVAPQHRDSARNLVHYVALRQQELRELQDQLAGFGLSTLTRLDADVLTSLDATLETVLALQEVRPRAAGIRVPLPGSERLRERRRVVLGPRRQNRTTRIMVTLPSEAAIDTELIGGYRTAGMDLARINLAHDDERAWRILADASRAAGALVAMDLAGPKVRTGPLAPGPRVLKSRPGRDTVGKVTTPAAVTLLAEDAGELAFRSDLPIGPTLPVAGPLLRTLRTGDRLRLVDARGAQRRLRVAQTGSGWAVLHHQQTIYFVPGSELLAAGGIITVGELPASDSFHLVHSGDIIELTRSLEPQQPSSGPEHRIGCTLGAVIDDAEPGHRVFFDDGKLAGLVVGKTPDALRIEVTRSRPGGVKLRAEKGINVPDTSLRIPALTEDDLRGLPVVAEKADLVNYSFVRSTEDVRGLIRQLERLQAHEVGIVLKIETEQAYRELPQLLLAALRWDKVGVMIARGDLAVEVGFERLAEVQEEILRLCEAAHVPVIWATQVLDTLARTGVPSRAEVTDAAMGRRAEAVMLNKGPFIESAIEALDGILERMGDVLSKQRVHLAAITTWKLGPVDDA